MLDIEAESELKSKNMPWLKYYPNHLPWQKQYTPKPLANIIDVAQENFSQHVCTDFLGKEMTYSEIGNAVNHTCKHLEELGVKFGTKVALLLPNTPTYIVYYYAILKLGAVVVNCNPLYSSDELEFQITDSEAEFLVSHDLSLTVKNCIPLLEKNLLKKLILVSFTAMLPLIKSSLFRAFKGKELMVPDSQWEETVEYVSYLDISETEPFKNRVTDPDNTLAVLQYTGGTTGTPKGAMLSHANLFINVQQAMDWSQEVVRIGEEVVLGILPFFHVFGMTAIMNVGISSGAKLVLIPKFELLDALKVINDKKPTVLPGVPTLFNAMINCPSIDKFDLSSLTYCVSGGAPLPLEVRKQFEKLAGCSLVEAYGLSETSPLVTTNPVDGPIRDGSIGLPVPSTRFSIRSIDAPHNELAHGETGEICISGPQVMSSYWKKPEQNETSFIDGYFRTGDVGYIDAEDGFIYIVDRLKDMIIASGYKIYPRQIEDVFYEHPKVSEVIVVGVPDEYRGESPKAFVKLVEGTESSQEELLEFVTTKLARHELPSQIEFRDELPKTIIGKLSRKDVK